jgi:hypothetical protein
MGPEKQRDIEKKMTTEVFWPIFECLKESSRTSVSSSGFGQKTA